MKKLASVSLLTGFLLAMTIGCGKDAKITTGSPDNASEDYSEKILSGKVAGKTWQFKSGTAKADGFDPNHIALTLSEQESADPCGEIFMTGRQVLTSVKRAEGETTLGTGQPMSTATFFYTKDGVSENMITTTGKIRILEITADRVVGQAVIDLDKNNHVNGAFEIPLCHDGFMP
jgi:hypothetical protein